MSETRGVWYGPYTDTDLPGKRKRWVVDCRTCPHMAYDIDGRWAARKAARDHADTHPGATVNKGR
ncbi:MAG: hypothetical protein JWO67_3994 [Streptosporangiaceae bacterium]|nr:hypothetical protein [Streptosporangiaceae bacterium]